MAMSLADKLTLLRLQNGYSKDDIASRLCVTENDISAWESGIATPDLNMLPKIAAFYSITVDALLNPDAIPSQAQQAPPSYTQTNYQQANSQGYQQQTHNTYNQSSAAAQAEFEQIKNEAKGFVFSKLFDFADSCVRNASHRATARMMFVFPFPLVIVAAYLFAGTVLHLWHPAWIMFLLIPCYYMIAASLRAKSRKAFFLIQPVPIVIVMLFLLIGFGLHIWHPTWILFLFIPAYYWFVAVFVRGRRHR
ncbi:MAG: helix-turn-helix transcriptional regulator [Ruminococcaceae bacterium]|nr:helix-turn-helix transcriptional regulator [Oscillospiraceae bacterium]